ncbi:peptidase M61 [Phenylobacterium sp.]|uniref:M61 family metallopeptidase n=1 Tax=Phenylobacterium sp. TaxID=1871053 RepID=UPI002F419162
MKPVLFACAAALVLSAATSGAALAQANVPNGPQPFPMPPKTEAPQDTPYPGTLKVAVDATDLDRHIYRVHETIPVSKAGPMTLLYPQWLPGNHAPNGPLKTADGFSFKANGQTLRWMRDPVDVFAFHIDVPPGATSIDIDFDLLTAVDGPEGRIVMTPEMLSLEWIDLVLYPAGHFARRIQVDPSVRFPEGFKDFSALETTGTEGGVTHYKTEDFATLADSPMIAGRYWKQFDLDPGGPARVSLDVIADRPELLDATPEEIDKHKALVQQAYKLYGSHHYNHYDFLFSLSSRMGGSGLEHHRSSEDGTIPDYFTDWAKTPSARDLLAHEYTHSWNGKFRRPADLWTPNFNVPMRGSLLWVYEGQTQYWGFVLAGRSGLISKQEALDALASTAATYANRVGREWRPVEDTTNDPVIASRRPQPWLSFQRSEDYYSEGQLVWLDADTLIRQKSGGKKSLDDFAREFFGINNGSWTTVTYTFDDVVAALNKVEPYDWATFLNERINRVAPKPPLDGLARGGWKLVYTDKETEYFKSAEMRRHSIDLTYSVGLTLGRDGDITAVQWDGPAFKAGLTIGAKIIAVNGIAYDMDRLKETITEAKKGGGTIDLLVKAGDHYKTVPIDYHGGLRYPRLERIEGTPDLLSAIYTPKK